MELTFANCERIVNTLPIGYYAGRRIGISVSKTEETSCYNPMSDTITISYPIIAERMKNIKDGSCDEEEAIRSMLYHEVSHAILTPNNLRNESFVNIFEDERIESIFRNYYQGVDFRKQLFDIHGGTIPSARDADSAFFNAVRFGLGGADVQNKINKVMKDYLNLNRNGSYDECWDYYYAVAELYNEITKEYRKNPQNFQPQAGQGQKQDGQNGKQKSFDRIAEGQNGKQGQGQEQGQGQTENGNEENNGNANGVGQGQKQEEEGQGASSNFYDPNGDGGRGFGQELSAQKIRELVENSMKEKLPLSPDDQQKLDEFRKTAEMIIGNFNKKNSGGSGINAYSGVFNPRAVARQDYRYFERSMTTQGNNKFGTCHLNLIIDRSGSFSHNAPLANGIISVLSEIERKNRNFTMDVAFINDYFHKCTSVDDRFLHTSGANDIPDDMKEIFMEMQKRNTCNYNIVLFDGDALCDGWDHHKKTPQELFASFDMRQTTLITDPANKRYMQPPFSSAKVVVTRNYNKELIDNVIHALTIAFG